MIELNCFGGCGSGLGMFLVLGVVGGITIIGLTIYIMFLSFKETPTNKKEDKI